MDMIYAKGVICGKYGDTRLILSAEFLQLNFRLSIWMPAYTVSMPVLYTLNKYFQHSFFSV